MSGSDLLCSLAMIGSLLVGCGTASGPSEDDELGQKGGSEDGAQQPALGALGIHITRVEANQGTAIPLTEADAWIGADGRLGPLVRDRDTLIRVYVALDPGWVARPLSAQLTIESDEGALEVFEQVRTVEAPSQSGDLASTFDFQLPASAGLVAPESRFQVELRELDEGATADAAGLEPGLWRSPAQPERLGVQPEPASLHVVFVPYRHVDEGIDRLADTSDTAMQPILDALYEQNPTSELVWEIHAPEQWDGPLANLGALLGPLAALRDQELAFPNLYYHALFPAPGGAIAGASGIGMIAGGGKGNLLERVSATAQGSDPEETAGTVVHELGHNQGLPHVACPYASASSPEPDYPYTDGLIGAWGYGLVSGALYDPAHHWDYMSYCNPSWVSPWSWALTQQRIVRLTSWNEARGGLRPLVVAATTELPGGARHSYWFVARGDAPDHPDQGDHPDQARRIELHAAGEPLASLPAQLVHASDPATTWLVAELPAAYAQLEGVDALVGVDGRARAFTARREQVVLPSPGGYQR